MKLRGFTLLELIVVIAIITILSVAVFAAVNPTKRFMDSRNVQRRTDVDAISEAVKLYYTDNDGTLPTGIDTSLRMLGTDSSGCNVTCGLSGGVGSGTTNLALNKTASASSEYSSFYDAGNVIDGNTGNFWLNNYWQGADGQWWQVDLGQQYQVNKAVIWWYNAYGSYNCNSMTIQGSNNGSSFSDVYGPVDTSSDPQESTYNFGTGDYRYWRFVCNDAVSSTFVVLREVYLYESIALGESTETSCLDISSDLNPYVPMLPVDPEVGSSAKTYYAVKALLPIGIKVVSCAAENNEEIEVSG